MKHGGENWLRVFLKEELSVFYEVRGLFLRCSLGLFGFEQHGFLEHQPE